MREIAEITLEDREKIKAYVEASNNLNFSMLAKRFNISKSQMSHIMNGKNTSVKANELIDLLLTMYGL